MKKNLIILALAIIVLAIIIILTNKVKPVRTENQEVGTYQTVEEEIDSINVDVGIDEDMKTIDADLENL